MEIKGTTKVTGVFGYPVSHSLSPVFQNSAFKYLGLDYVYIPFEVKPQDLKEAVKAIKIFHWIGVNVTIPHKKQVIKYLDELDENSKILKVVNTIHNTDGKLKGYTTDGEGFLRSLKEDGKFKPEGKNVFILGAGGSSYAICGALINEKVNSIFITNRTLENAKKLKKNLVEKLKFKNIEIIEFEKRNDKKIWQNIDLLINTTSVGMKENDPLLIEKENIEMVKFVYDIVYNRKTELLKTAENLKIPYLDGISMLVYQGAISFEIWTGKKAPVDIMKKALYEKI
ncbi:MAG: shikimate dehydrogenase [Candidatus Omnitrophica bacterium]|nr:shikimate dehydrogenase [Candidatus Omnitrophota bacterium]MCM8809265.1 shikimate dehydrogenase [Candidatus Omnitrophota bacterium]MCM8832609.1 shikimate dehydrogenase [Candidatus Omnitrophota bacterium]